MHWGSSRFYRAVSLGTWTETNTPTIFAGINFVYNPKKEQYHLLDDDISKQYDYNWFAMFPFPSYTHEDPNSCRFHSANKYIKNRLDLQLNSRADSSSTTIQNTILDSIPATFSAENKNYTLIAAFPSSQLNILVSV